MTQDHFMLWRFTTTDGVLDDILSFNWNETVLKMVQDSFMTIKMNGLPLKTIIVYSERPKIYPLTRLHLII